MRFRPCAPFPLVALVLAACGPSPAGGPDAGAEDTARPDAGPQVDAGACSDVVDLVFVLDTSSSMGFVLSQLEAQIAQVVAATNDLAADAHFGLVVFQDNELLDATGPQSGGTVHTDATTLQTAFRNYRENFTDMNRNPGDGVSGPSTQNPICEENSLDALHAAAAEYPWRDNATRVIIVATDDTFLEAPDNYGDRDGDGQTNRTDYPREGNYPAAHTLSDTVTALRDQRVRVFSFTRIEQPGIFSRCGTGRRMPWASITDGWTTPYAGNPPIPEQTDGRNFDLDAVRDEQLSLADTINEIVLDSYCQPPVL